MALLTRFSPPGHAELPDSEGWSDRLARQVAGFASLPRFFDPLKAEGSPTSHPVKWPAFPGELRQPGMSDDERWELSDRREHQDEYCEWVIERSGDEIASVTFTTETPDHFDHLLATDPAALVALYEELVGARPNPAELRSPDGSFIAANPLNHSSEGKIVHLSEPTNTLGAAVTLVAKATVLRSRDGAPVTEKKALVRCGGLGGEFRNSDPQIAEAVNGLVRAGAAVSVADPAGLYIDEFLSSGLQTPDGANAAEFWTLTNRGDSQHPMRATFAVPADRGYSVSDITSGGKPIRFGGQLADRVRVRVTALSLPGASEAPEEPCVDQGA
jgi:hypothetical protein